jgi:hypothetical protein
MNLKNIFFLCRIKDRSPIIVIILKSLINHNKYRWLPYIHGGRFQLIRSQLNDFFQTLIDNGAKLVFFNDEAMGNHDGPWIGIRNWRYEKFIDILKNIGDGNAIIYDQDVPNFSTFLYETTKVASTYGEIINCVDYPIVLQAAAYAKWQNVCAVLADNTDFLMFGGKWKYLSTKSLVFTTMMTKEYDRAALRQHLKLREDEMPIFGTYSGNKIIAHGDLKASVFR